MTVKKFQEHGRPLLFRLKSCLSCCAWLGFGAGASYWSDHQSLPPRRPIGQITNKCRQQQSTLYVYKSCHRHTRAGRGEGGGSSPRSRYLLWFRWIQLSLRHLNHNLNNSAWISTFLSFLCVCPFNVHCTSTIYREKDNGWFLLSYKRSKIILKLGHVTQVAKFTPLLRLKVHCSPCLTQLTILRTAETLSQ